MDKIKIPEIIRNHVWNSRKYKIKNQENQVTMIFVNRVSFADAKTALYYKEKDSYSVEIE